MKAMQTKQSKYTEVDNSLIESAISNFSLCNISERVSE